MTIIENLQEVERSVATLGSSLTAPFATLSFLALPVLPELRLTDRGLVVQTPASRGQESNHPLRFRCRNWSFVFALQGLFCG